MRVGFLGPLELSVGGRAVPVGGEQLRSLLVRLASAGGRPVSAAALLEDLWGAGGRLNTLQSLVSRLRGALGSADAVTSVAGGYRLAVEPDSVDALRFERLVREARELPPAARAPALHAALQLWRGPALADVRGLSFGVREAERLERARLAALEDRIEAELDMGAGADLVVELESLAAGHPIRERVHAQLILALAASGRRGDALAAYERIRGRLAEAYGCDPGPHLRAAYLAALRTEPPQRRSASGNLSASLTSFVGRDDDVVRVVGRLESARMVTIVGAGGVGKTRLANEAGRRLTPTGGIWFVPLASRGAHDVTQAVYDVVRVRAGSSTRGSVAERLVEVLSADDPVVILDNCEHVADAAAGLATRLLGCCPRLRILATSREALRVDGEHVHPVLPLRFPGPDASADEIRAAAAVRLFADRAYAVDPDAAFDDAALRTVAEICRRLDGLPLAIELAAARLRSLPLQAVATRLNDRFDLLTEGSRTALPRQQTLRAAVAWSWDLLDADERTLAERLAVIPGSFGEDAAAALGEPENRVPDLLAALVAKSLLYTTEPTEPRYRMLLTIREFGLQQLTRRGETDPIRARHAAFLLDLAETADAGLRGSDQLVWLARLVAERENLSAAVRWAARSGTADLAGRLAVALSWFWYLRDDVAEARAVTDLILRTPGPIRPEIRSLVTLGHALAVHELSAPETTPAALDRVRVALHGVGSHPLVGLARLRWPSGRLTISLRATWSRAPNRRPRGIDRSGCCSRVSSRFTPAGSPRPAPAWPGLWMASKRSANAGGSRSRWTR
ncbi:BTAD domain-containing putative transcriptional regulator [Cryptosporangium sp. NPDC051539]|uniref:BTAD domain-containing putative transcriptional regulator n=1 Tax=Cryptosporangium sp. NPDC051539 TaxID=3363962 RepID=UPI0037B1AEFB